MTTILTYWACAMGTFCAQPADANTMQIPGSIVQCEEAQAITDLDVIDGVLADGNAPRHTCVISGQAL